MKAAQLILQQLTAAKKVTLQELGTFYLSPDIHLPESDKEPVIPEGAITFSGNPKAGMDEDLINFIMQQTRKIRPLATSDLESYLHLGKQFLNLGKPFVIEGLGFLQKNSSGEVIFTPSFTSLAKTEMLPPEPREKGNEEISFASQPKKKNHWKTWIPLALVIIFLTASVLYFLLGRKQDKEVNVPTPANTHKSEKTTRQTQPVQPAPVTPSAPSAPAVADINSDFRIVLRQYPDSFKARRFFNLIRNSHPSLVLYSVDSTKYNVGVQFRLPLADTLRVRDSIARLVGLRTWIDLSNN